MFSRNRILSLIAQFLQRFLDSHPHIIAVVGFHSRFECLPRFWPAQLCQSHRGADSIQGDVVTQIGLDVSFFGHRNFGLRMRLGIFGERLVIGSELASNELEARGRRTLFEARNEVGHSRFTQLDNGFQLSVDAFVALQSSNDRPAGFGPLFG